MSARSIVSSAKLVALCTLVSRVTGLLRDILLARAFGVGWVQDAFSAAFLVPNLFRRLFGEGALTAAFVPTFTRVLAHQGRPAAWALFARALTLMTSALVVLTLLGELLVGALWLMLPAGHPYVLPLALTAVMLPFMVSICLLALVASLLNCLGSFVVPALASVVLNIVMIAGIVWAAPWFGGDDPARQVFGVAWSVVAAGLLQLAFVYPAMRARGVPLGWRFETHDPVVREMLARIVPVMLGQGVLMLSTFLDSLICVLLTRIDSHPHLSLLGLRLAYPLEEGALAAVTFAQRLYQFPLGVLVISLATVALPAFSRLAAQSDWNGWAAQVRAMIRLAVFEGLLAGSMLVVLAVPITRLLFEYGRFDQAATQRSAYVAMFYGFGLCAFCAQHIVLRGFYSLHDVRTPVWISCAILPLNLLLTLLLIWLPSVREAALAISSSVTSSAAVLIGIALLSRRQSEALLDADTLLALARMLLAAILAATAVYGLRAASLPLLEDVPGVLPRRLLDALGWLCVGSGVYVAAAWLLRLPEAAALLRERRPRT
ncbi:MAG TPA: murein biosynthesis integral membrane protein MurJ [Phycisphaerae bacterium]|nr:murein biosynthesis integral membrane protein MurJ [Phycisphaerae bacterium]